MKILLDENLDWRLRKDLPGHQVESVPLIGWAGLKNGALLAKAEQEFDVLLTMDAGIGFQTERGQIQNRRHRAQGPEQSVGRYTTPHAQGAYCATSRKSRDCDDRELSDQTQRLALLTFSNSAPWGGIGN